MIKESKAQEIKWQTERDFDTLMEYEKLIKEPERLKRAKALAEKKKNELASLLSRNNKKED